MADGEKELTRRTSKANVAVTRKHMRRDQQLTDRRKSRGLPQADNKQQQLKEAREAKRATLDARHQHLFASIATRLGMEDSEVEDFMLEGEQVIFTF